MFAHTPAHKNVGYIYIYIYIYESRRYRYVSFDHYSKRYINDQ